MKKIIATKDATISLVDVYGSVSLVTWLCGCNLKCPYCHNWEIASYSGDCRAVGTTEFMNVILRAERLVEYVQISGGEPLLQASGLTELYMTIRDNTRLKTSLNSSLVLYNVFKTILDRVDLNHVATDLKISFKETTGLDERVAKIYWNNYIRSLSLAVEKNVFLEIRIPVFRGLRLDEEEKFLSEALDVVDKTNHYVIVIQPVLGEPFVKPRSSEWCEDKCNPRTEDLELAKEWFKTRGYTKIHVRD